MDWSIVLGSIFFFIVLVFLCLWPFLRHRHAQRTVTPEQQHYIITEERGTGTERKGREHHHNRKEPSYPIPYSGLTKALWFWQWDWFYHGKSKETREAAMAALDIFTRGLAQRFYDWIELGAPQAQPPDCIEASIHYVTTEPMEAIQQESASLSPLQLLNLEMLKGEGRIALYEVYALGLLAYLYNHLPPSGTIHRDDNKREPGWVGGQVISSTQWDQFIGSSSPNTQKGQGVLRRAGLIVERDLEGRRVTTFTTPDVGQAISILTQYLISEQQGQHQVSEPKVEQAAPLQRRSKIDEEEKVVLTQECNWF